MNTTIKIGLFGFGVVGEGLYKVLAEAPNASASIKKVVVKDKQKARNIPAELVSFEANDILEDPEINLIVELINDANDAYLIVKTALEKGISVVSGNKNMIAHHLEELIDIQEKSGAALLYDASACGSIPVIRNLEEYYDNDLLISVTGILNGSSNYILSQIFNKEKSYQEALKDAQNLGFAESDPSFDVNGFDALYKLVIITVHAFGVYVKPEEIFQFGIANIQQNDIVYAREKNRKIKLVAQVCKTKKKQISMYVLPKLVTSEELIYNVEDEYNGVVIEGEFYDKQFMFGKGAGGFPTGSSVLSDISARLHQYKYEYKKRKFLNQPVYTDQTELKIYLRYRNLVDFSYFDFLSISEKYSSSEFNYVVGTIKLSDLLKIKNIIPKLDIFIAEMGE